MNADEGKQEAAKTEKAFTLVVEKIKNEGFVTLSPSQMLRINSAKSLASFDRYGLNCINAISFPDNPDPRLAQDDRLISFSTAC